jgi:hypothetical protein
MPIRSELIDPNNLIDKKLASEPIILPDSPFWEIFNDFGKDELIALIINTVGTGAISAISKDPLLLSVFGPLVEKIGFFVGSSQEALQVYRTTSPEERKHKMSYLMDAVKNGMPNLMKDIIFHDPIYTALMLMGLEAFPDTSAWLLSMIAFLLSVGAITGGEVAVKEAFYKSQTRYLERKGFELEQHLEARFAVKGVDPQELIIQLASFFNLGEIHTSTYHDQYFQTTLKPYNAREPVIRLRQRTEQGEELGSSKVQVVYTKASEVVNGQPEQYNYFPVSKDKFSFPVDEQIPKFVGKMVTDDDPHEVSFTRTYANIPGELLISVDLVNGQPYTVVEIKSFRKNKQAVETMIMVMRHIMSQYDVIQTTHSKRTMTDLKE